MDKALLQATRQQFGKAAGRQNIRRTKQTGVIITPQADAILWVTDTFAIIRNPSGKMFDRFPILIFDCGKLL
jgi:hypothetical protein